MGDSKLLDLNKVVEKRFRFQQLLFRLAGCPIFQTKESKFVFALSVISFYMNFVAVLMDTCMNIQNIERAMEDVRLAFPIASGICIHLFMRLRREAVERLLLLTEPFTWEGMPTRDPDTGYLTMAAWIPRINTYAQKIAVLLFVLHCIYVIFRFLSSEDRLLQFNSWYPFETSTTPQFELVNATQFVGSIMCFFSFIAFISLYATLVCIACSQLEKLRANLVDIKQRQNTSEQDSGAESDQKEEELHTSQDVFRHMQEQLNDCIRHHQNTLEFMRALEATMNPILLAHFLLLEGGMCFTAFSAVTTSGLVLQLGQILVVYVAFVIQLYTYGWFGTELTRQAESVCDAAWGSDWVGTPGSFQKCLSFVIATSRREFTLTAGGFVPVSRESMLTMINQTISYFMFLLNLKDIEKEALQ